MLRWFFLFVLGVLTGRLSLAESIELGCHFQAPAWICAIQNQTEVAFQVSDPSSLPNSISCFDSVLGWIPANQSQKRKPSQKLHRVFRVGAFRQANFRAILDRDCSAGLQIQTPELSLRWKGGPGWGEPVRGLAQKSQEDKKWCAYCGSEAKDRPSHAPVVWH